MITSIFTMGIIFIIIGIASRLAFGISFDDPFAFISTTPPTDLPIDLQKSGEYFIKWVSSAIWTAGIIFVVVGFLRK